MTIRLKPKSFIERLLNLFGYERKPDDLKEIKDTFGQYTQVEVPYGAIDFDGMDILAELSLLANKLVAVAASIEGLNELDDNDRESAIYGISKMMIELSNQVSVIHGAYEIQQWQKE